MNLLEKFNHNQLTKLSEGKKIDNFRTGDTLKVDIRIIEGASERIQTFEGLCIAIRGSGIDKSIVVRKISHNEGVEKIFLLYSPKIVSVNVVRRGIVRRSKLYYMRNLRGKAARLKERREISPKTNEGQK